MEATSARWRWILVTAIAPIAWGSVYVVTRQALPADIPLWGAALRALPAGLLLLLLARRLPRGQWWWRSLVLGVLNVGAFFVLIYLAAQLLPSSVASTIMATSPAVIMLLAWPLLRQTPRAASAIGAGIGFVGVLLMLAPGGESIEPWGVVASFAAMVSSSIGFVLARRWGGDVPLVASTAWQLVVGGMLLLPLAALVEGPLPTLEPTAWAGLAYISLVATAIAFVAWFTGLRHLPAQVVGVVGLLNPVTGVLLGTLLVGEAFGPAQAAGVALVLGGVAVGAVLTRPKRVSSPSVPSGSPPVPADSSERE